MFLFPCHWSLWYFIIFIAFNSNTQNPEFLAKTLDRLPKVPNQSQNIPQIWHGGSDNNAQALHLAYRTYQSYYNDKANNTCKFISNVCNFCIFVFCVFYPYCVFHHPNQHRLLFVKYQWDIFSLYQHMSLHHRLFPLLQS